jgi:hypothetical protein
MTLCIAARSEYGGEPRIVLCFDDKIGTDLVSYRGAFKCDYLADGLAVVYAGVVSPAKELIEDYKARLEKQPLTHANARGRISSVYARWKKRLLNRSARHTFGHPYEWVIKNQLDNTDVLLASMPSVELLIAGFLPKRAYDIGPQPVIFHVDEQGVNEMDDIHGIGLGWENAQPILGFREYTSKCGLDKALYFVHEAKKLAEVSDKVGKMTTILVLEPNTQGGFIQRVLQPGGSSFLDRSFAKYGPRPLDTDYSFPFENLI